MKKIEVTPHFDAAELQGVLELQEIWNPTCHDECPGRAPVGLAEMIFSIPDSVSLRVTIDEKLGGYFLVIPLRGVYEAHTMLLDNCRGQNAIRAGRAAVKWFFEHRDAALVRSYAREDHPEVSFFARACGFTAIGFEPKDVLVHGKPVRTEILELRR